MKIRKWSNRQLIEAVKVSRSYRQVIENLGLVPAGGNYNHVQRIVSELKINTDHFSGKGWASGMKFKNRFSLAIDQILIKNSNFQSYKLKNRLFDLGLKSPKCELCGWASRSVDGRIPVELDHVNGDHRDNRIENLRVLCPNCHSLQSTHRGANKVKYKSK